MKSLVMPLQSLVVTKFLNSIISIPTLMVKLCFGIPGVFKISEILPKR